MRTSNNLYGVGGRLLDGYDYVLQVWVAGGVFVTCGHVDACRCFGRIHEGEATK